MSGLSVTHALALRRVAVTAGALGAALLAHCAASGDLVITGMAPFTWIGLLSAVTVLGGRRRWSPRGFAGSLALMAAAQAAVHLAMTATPWAFGLAPHHGGDLAVAPATLAAHAGAAVLLAALVTWLEAGLGRAMALLRRVRRWLSARPAGHPGALPVPSGAASPRPARGRGGLVCRGPPGLRPA